MSKKILVKQVIDRLIKEGEDFSDLTQGYLSGLSALEGVSKTTIKRAKSEYKQQNASIKNNYKEQRIKKKIYKFLDRYPRASLGDLREEFPNIIPPKVSEYHLFWKRKQEKKLKKDQKALGVITPRKLKEMVFKYLDESPYTTAEQLSAVFAEANRNSVNSYFNHWKKKQLVDKESVKKGSLVQVLFDYLDKNPSSTIDDLQKAFTDVHKKSLEIYFSLWRKKHQESEVTIVETIKQEVLQLVEKSNGTEEIAASLDAPDLEKTGQEILPNEITSDESLIKTHPDSLKENRNELAPVARRQNKPEGKKPAQRVYTKQIAVSKAILKDNLPTSVDEGVLEQDLISCLENTIEAQKAIIEVLNFEQHALKQKKEKLRYTSLDMSDKELAEVKDFLALFLEGYKHQRNKSI